MEGVRDGVRVRSIQAAVGVLMEGGGPASREEEVNTDSKFGELERMAVVRFEGQIGSSEPTAVHRGCC